MYDKPLITALLTLNAGSIREVVQVGACDGVAFDFYRPLWEIYKWKSTFIEPHPELFKKLEANYPDSTCLNLAIDIEQGVRPLFYNLEEAYGNSSFYKKHKDTLSKELLVKTELLENVCSDKTDLIIMDCEGYDETLLLNLKVFPKIIIWEATYSSNLEGIINYLNSLGYNSFPGDPNGFNYISLRT